MVADRFISLLFRFRLFAALLISLTTALSIWGITQLQFNDNLADFLKADNTDYRTLLRFFEDFGADDTNCVLVLTTDNWFSPASASYLRRLTGEAAELPGVDRVYSLLDVRRRVPGLRRVQIPLMPREEAKPESFGKARSVALKHPLVAGQLLSSDGKTTLVVVRLPGRDLSVSEMQPTVEALQTLLDRVSQGTEVETGMTGIPRLRVDIYHAVRRDQAFFICFGVFIATLIALILFRRPMAVLIVSAGPVIGTLWTVGALGWVGEPVNSLNSILPALVMVIGFTDSVHFMIEMRRQRITGREPLEAARVALRHLWLPCGLTSLTTAIGFGSLMVAHIEIIQRFGAVCAVGAVLNFLAVISTVPLLASTRLGKYVAGGSRVSVEDHSYRILRRVVAWITQHARLVAATGCILTAVLVVLTLQLEPDNRIKESMPTGSPSYQALTECERVFGGALQTYVVIEWPESMDFKSHAVLKAIADVHVILGEQPELGTPFSVLNVLASLSRRPNQLNPGFLSRVPAKVLNQLVQQESRKAAVSIQTPDAGARVLRPMFARVEQRLDKLVREEHQGFRMQLTGSPVVAARNLNLIIVDLCTSLGLASVIIFVVMTLVFRSIRRGAISVLPNVFPLVSAAAILIVVRNGAVEISSIITFSICLGIAVDDTIHFISRFEHELSEGHNVIEAIQQSVAKVGAALLVTTLTLLGGFGAGVFSQLPALRVFGLLSCVALVTALFADVLILPALLVFDRRAVGLQRGQQDD